MSKKIVLLILVISFVSIFFNVVLQERSPPCFNADEAAFGYNAFSILSTGKDEYGNVLPLRLKSFGDYKMPLYSYLSVPFIAAFGLTETSTRMLNVFLAFLFPFALFFLVKELLKHTTVALIASLLVSTSLGLHIVSRHAHEAYLSAFLITINALFFVRVIDKNTVLNQLLFFTTLVLSLFSYQSNRIFALFFFVISFIFFLRRKQKRFVFIGIFIVILGLFAFTDVKYNPTRLKNLVFFNNEGFGLKIDELKRESAYPRIYNELTVGIKDVIFEHLKYYSPQYLITNGDENSRFGFAGMSLINPIEYLFLFVGLYYLVKKKERWRYLLLGLFIIAPFTSSLTWARISLTRSLFFLIPVLIISSYGLYQFLISLPGNKRILTVISIMMIYLFFFLYNWDFYLFHYPKRAIVINSWQCGYRELASYVKNNYHNYDRFYISKTRGMPYVFLLYYLRYPPEKYQKQATLSSPDQYGFGQIEEFDKFTFTFNSHPKERNYVLIGAPEDYDNSPKFEGNRSAIKKISKNATELFWIYESKDLK